METSVIRSDPVTDNQPEVRFGHGSQRFAYLLVMTLGLALIFAGVYARFLEKQTWIPELCIAGGVAIAAPGLLSYLYRRYMLEEIKLEIQQPAEKFRTQATQIVREAVNSITDNYKEELTLLHSARRAGLVSVFVSRNEALGAFVPYLEDEKHEVLIVGSSLRGLLREQDQQYERVRAALKRRKDMGIRLRFLLTHPNVADLRARQENRKYTDIGTEIVESIDCLLGPEWEIPFEDVKLYMGTPTCFGVKTGEGMLINPYPFLHEAFASPCLIVRSHGYVYEHFRAGHFKAWDSRQAEVLTADLLKELRSSLSAYANEIRRLLGDLADHEGTIRTTPPHLAS